jgi:hypothetical protein
LTVSAEPQSNQSFSPSIDSDKEEEIKVALLTPVPINKNKLSLPRKSIQLTNNDNPSEVTHVSETPSIDTSAPYGVTNPNNYNYKTGRKYTHFQLAHFFFYLISLFIFLFFRAVGSSSFLSVLVDGQPATLLPKMGEGAWICGFQGSLERQQECVHPL